MHIAVLADPIFNQFAGIHTYTKGMVHALEKATQVNKLSIIGPSIIPEPSFPGYIGVKKSPFFKKNDPYRHWITLPKVINKLCPDVVIEPAHFGPVRLNPRIFRITIIHDLVPLKFPSYVTASSIILHKLFLENILKHTNLIVTNSFQTRSDLINYFPKTASKTHVIYPGINIDYPPDHQSNTENYFLTVSTLEPRKNIGLILEAYRLFREENQDKNTALVIVGKNGWKYHSIHQQINTHPFKEDIFIKGYINQDELMNLYIHCKAFIIASKYEGFGFSLAEAIHFEKKCLAAYAGSLPEVGKNHVSYFNPENPSSLSNLLIQENKTKTYENLTFSWESYSDRLLSLIHKNI